MSKWSSLPLHMTCRRSLHTFKKSKISIFFDGNFLLFGKPLGLNVLSDSMRTGGKIILGSYCFSKFLYITSPGAFQQNIYPCPLLLTNLISIIILILGATLIRFQDHYLFISFSISECMNEMNIYYNKRKNTDLQLFSK